MLVIRELIISVTGLALLTTVAAYYPYFDGSAPNTPDFRFGLAAAFFVLLPVLILPPFFMYRRLKLRAIFGILLIYWLLSFGMLMFGYAFETTAPALSKLIFGWLLFVCICGIPIIIAIPTIWEKFRSS